MLVHEAVCFFGKLELSRVQNMGSYGVLYLNHFLFYINSMKLDFEKMGGLVPAVVQDVKTNEILMVGFMNEEAWKQTLETAKVTFFSRTKNRLWIKGESSNHFLIVKEVFVDCDNDTVLIKADPQGPTCHTGNTSCFSNKVELS